MFDGIINALIRAVGSVTAAIIGKKKDGKNEEILPTQFPPGASIFREKVRTLKFTKSGTLKENTEREVSYVNGRALEAMDIPSPVTLSDEKQNLLEEARDVIKSKKDSAQLLPTLDKLKSIEELKIEDRVVLSRLFLTVGDTKFGQNDFVSAETFYKEALEYGKSAEEPKIIKLCLYELGASVGMQGRHDEALKCFDEILEKDKEDYASWFNKGVSLSSLNRYDESIIAYEKAIKFGILAESLITVTNAYYNMGLVLGELKRHPEAIESYVQSIEYGAKADEWGTVSSAYYNMGKAQNELKRHTKAIRSYVQATKCGTKAEKWSTVTKAYYNKGVTQNELKRHPEAIESYIQAVECGRKADKWGTVASAYYNMGNTQNDLKRYPEALESYVQAVECGTKAEKWGTVTRAYYNLGVVQLILKKLPEASVSFLKALELRSHLPDKGERILPDITSLLCILGTIAVKDNDPNTQILSELLSKVFTDAKTDGMDHLIEDAIKEFESKLDDEVKKHFAKFKELFEQAISKGK